MIIQVQSAATENVEAARRSLRALAHSWGHDMAEPPDTTPEAAGAADNGPKVIDPVSLAALVLSIPSAALAVVDLADRIHKRRRAKELINHARELAAQQVTVCLMSQSRSLELTTLDPDQLLDLLADENLTN